MPPQLSQLDTGTHRLPHPNLSDPVNHNLVQAEIEGGVYLNELPHGATIEVQTLNRSYRLVNHGHGKALISGHPRFCPQPTLVTVDGSNWGGSMLKLSFIGRGMCMEFRHPSHRTITTSKILEIRQV